MLAGDHLKSASDLGVSLVGVGLLYQQGYFRQYLDDAGWQQERREEVVNVLISDHGAGRLPAGRLRLARYRCMQRDAGARS